MLMEVLKHLILLYSWFKYSNIFLFLELKYSNGVKTTCGLNIANL